LEKEENEALYFDCFGEYADSSVKAIATSIRSTEKCDMICDRVVQEEDEEMDISEDEDEDLTYAKNHTSGLESAITTMEFNDASKNDVVYSQVPPISTIKPATLHNKQIEKSVAHKPVPPLILANDLSQTASSTRPATLHKQPKPTVKSKSSETLTFKRARLAKALNKARIEAAKAKLRVAQLKKQEALRAKMTREAKGHDTTSKSSATEGRSSVSNKKTPQKRIDTANVSKSSPPGAKTATYLERKPIVDISAYRMSSLIISGITASGPPEKVRPVLSGAIVDGEDCQRSMSDHQSINTLVGTAGHTTVSSSSSKVVTSDQAVNVDRTSNSPLTLKKETEKSEKESESRKLNLKLIKTRLMVKILEKTRATRKRLADSKKQAVQFPKHADAEINGEKVSLSLSDCTSTVENDPNTLKIVVEDQGEKDSTVLASKQAQTSLPTNEDDLMQNSAIAEALSGLSCISTKDIALKPSENTLSDVKQMHSPEAAILDLKKEVINKLRERQTILKESIDSSKEANKELKYEKGVSDLAILVQRQHKMLKYHGYEIGEGKSSLQKCRKQLSEEKNMIIVSEKELVALLKRKKVMESMVFSTTTKLIDCRRKRGLMLKRLEEKNAN